MKKRKFVYLIIALLILYLLYSVVTNFVSVEDSDNESKKIEKEAEEKGSIVYYNEQYNFCFLLPESWLGYKIVSDKWEGISLENSDRGQIVETGPIIKIRHPQWTAENPRQDIPIMVFTLSQWDLLQQEKYHIGAAPIGPKELGRNNRYVFALPARYNYAFPEGYEEVDKNMDSKPLKPLDDIQ